MISKWSPNNTGSTPGASKTFQPQGCSYLIAIFSFGQSCARIAPRIVFDRAKFARQHSDERGRVKGNANEKQKQLKERTK
jgi:hypothetical protein